MSVKPHPTWHNLEIRPQVGHQERVLGFVDDCKKLFKNYVVTVAEPGVVKISSASIDTPKEPLCVRVMPKSPRTEFTGSAPNLEVWFDDAELLEMGGFEMEQPATTGGVPAIRYDNLINVCIMVKNGGPTFERVLRENMHLADRWTILDTGSTDGTQGVVRRVLDGKRYLLAEEPFVNFRDSRNRCLDLAGDHCKFNLMLDDTYIVRGDLRSFLHEVRGDEFATSFCLVIRSDDVEYQSNRITPSTSNLRYMYTIHEVIQTERNERPVLIPIEVAHVEDLRSEYMEARTMARKRYDLERLEEMIRDDPQNPRHLYYMAQTYSLLDDHEQAAEWFKRRFDSTLPGLAVERMDAGFEYARILNFKMEGVPWARVEGAYLEAYDCEPRRPDALYFIGIHYWLEDKQAGKALHYLERAFRLGYPTDTQFSLKPTMVFHFLPLYLAEVCYDTGEWDLGMAACDRFLAHARDPPMLRLEETQDGRRCRDRVVQYRAWFGHLVKLHQAERCHSAPARSSRPAVAIVADGNWERWNASTMMAEGLGGSETWAVELSRSMARQFGKADVVVFCRKASEKEGRTPTVDNPQPLFLDLEELYGFLASRRILACIVSRFSEYLPLAIAATSVRKVVYAMHDVAVPNEMIPTHTKLERIVTLTPWHKEQFLSVYPAFEHRVAVLGYGCRGIAGQSEPTPPEARPRFIYPSFPNRGLVHLLRMWPRVRELFPAACLDVFADLDGEWVNRVVPEVMVEIKQRVRDLRSEGVVVRGWVGKGELYAAWSRADVWLYPCTFEETFCLTALEAAASRTLCVVPPLAALRHTVRHGIVVEGDASTERWAEEALAKLKGITGEDRDRLLGENERWAGQRSWRVVASEWVELLGLADFGSDQTAKVAVHHWEPIKECVDMVSRWMGGQGTVLELGPGSVHFPRASVFVDNVDRGSGAPSGLVVMDVDGGNCGDWPFGDDHFAGGYARHVFEDLSEPSCALREMMRVCRKGYTETPSVQAECSLGVDAGETGRRIRGYRHHHWLSWVDGETNTLCLLPKILVNNLIVEFRDEPRTVEWLEKHTVAWNSYYFWDKDDPLLQPSFRIFNGWKQVVEILNVAWRLSLANVRKMQARLLGPIVSYHLVAPPQPTHQGLCNQMYGLVRLVSRLIRERDLADRPIVVHVSRFLRRKGDAASAISTTQVLDPEMWTSAHNVVLVDASEDELSKCVPVDIIQHDGTVEFDDLLSRLEFAMRYRQQQGFAHQVVHLRLESDMIRAVASQQGITPEALLAEARRKYVSAIRAKGDGGGRSCMVLCDGEPDAVVADELRNLGWAVVIPPKASDFPEERAIADLIAASQTTCPAILCYESTFSHTLSKLKRGSSCVEFVSLSLRES